MFFFIVLACKDDIPSGAYTNDCYYWIKARNPPIGCDGFFPSYFQVSGKVKDYCHVSCNICTGNHILLYAVIENEVLLAVVYYISSIFFICAVSTNDEWILVERGMICPEIIVKDMKESLDDCKTYCKLNGATRLTYYPFRLSDIYKTIHCHCCAASSDLVPSELLDPKLYARAGIPFSN